MIPLFVVLVACIGRTGPGGRTDSTGGTPSPGVPAMEVGFADVGGYTLRP